MEPIFVCDSSDRPLWLQERRKYVTSSDIAAFLGMQPSWWSFSNRDTVVADKMGRGSFEANPNTEHGIFNEECNRLKAEKLLGMVLPPCQKLYRNPKWPHLAATPDCYALPGPLAAPRTLLTTRPLLVDLVRSSVAQEATVGGCQLKSTDAVHAVQYGKRGYKKEGEPQDWITHPPDYHLPQVQAEMYVMGWSWTLLIAQLGAHNMVPWFVRRDPAFEAVMDEAETQAAELLDGIAREAVAV
jgi:hypothetical protein